MARKQFSFYPTSGTHNEYYSKEKRRNCRIMEIWKEMLKNEIVVLTSRKGKTEPAKNMTAYVMHRAFFSATRKLLKENCIYMDNFKDAQIRKIYVSMFKKLSKILKS